MNNVNPAGTVPVLVHNGHPIYESHEQIVYIDQVLMPGGPKLTPSDPEKKTLMEKWLESGKMLTSEGQCIAFACSISCMFFQISLYCFIFMAFSLFLHW